jgi:hypothetical protein
MSDSICFGEFVSLKHSEPANRFQSEISCVQIWGGGGGRDKARAKLLRFLFLFPNNEA